MKWEVAVVGAGPGGAFTARELAKKGFNVILFEKERFPRDKLCGGWLTPLVVKKLGWNENKIKMHRFKNIRVYDPYLNSVLVGDMVDNYTVLREEFDHALAQDAVDAGVELKESAAVKSLSLKKDEVQIKSRDQSFSASLVVGADGTHSIVARELGLRKRWKKSELIFCMGALLREPLFKPEHLSEEMMSTVQIFLFNFSRGYGWLSAQERVCNIGLAEFLPHLKEPRKLWKQFINTLKRAGFNFSFHALKPKGYMYNAVRGPTGPTFGERVLLVGDAGGFASNLTGEGIGPAIVTAEMAASVIERALEKEDFSAHYLKNYEKRWQEAFGDTYLTNYRFLKHYFAGFPILRRYALKNLVPFLEAVNTIPELKSALLRGFTDFRASSEIFSLGKPHLSALALAFLKNKFKRLIHT